MGDKKRKSGGERELEVLRGKNKQLQKQIKSLENYVKFLENQLSLSQNTKNSSKNVDVEVNNEKEKNTCDRCGKGIFKKITVQSPSKTLEFFVCQICYHRIPIGRNVSRR